MRTPAEEKAFQDGVRAGRQQLSEELAELKAIKAGVENLIRQKGRHNTQIAYERLVALMQEED